MAIKEQAVCEGLEWIDVMDPTQQEIDELAATYNLNSYTVRDCMEPEHLPKYEFVDDVHFLILRFYAHRPNTQASTIQELTNKIAIFYTKRFIITIHKAEAQFLEIIRKRYVSNARCDTSTSLLTKVLWWALESYDDPVGRLSEQVDFYENQVILKKTGEDYTEKLFYIKREASITQKVLMLMLEPINNVFVSTGEEVELQNVRDQHLKMQTLYSQVLEEANNLMNVYMSYQAQRTNDVVKVLTIFSVFFMPLTFIAGIYGMNFDYMPELRQKWGYLGVLVLMALISLLIYLYFRRKGWLK